MHSPNRRFRALLVLAIFAEAAVPVSYFLMVSIIMPFADLPRLSNPAGSRLRMRLTLFKTLRATVATESRAGYYTFSAFPSIDGKIYIREPPEYNNLTSTQLDPGPELPFD